MVRLSSVPNSEKIISDTDLASKLASFTYKDLTHTDIAGIYLYAVYNEAQVSVEELFLSQNLFTDLPTNPVCSRISFQHDFDIFHKN